ncbi:hypothetical protein BX600DRAFT_465798 [Xylariales sp. PMI_506]|nr:hypothetical protein BX600DRAFT_465798 [Xylariales sp. PMI_506]
MLCSFLLWLKVPLSEGSLSSPAPRSSLSQGHSYSPQPSVSLVVGGTSSARIVILGRRSVQLRPLPCASHPPDGPANG